MTTAYQCATPNVAPPLPEEFFDFAFEQLTWQSVREHLPLDESRRWTIAQAGPWLLQAHAKTDETSSLDDWTCEEDSPELYRKMRDGNLWHIGLIVEINANGILLAHDSCWAIALDTSSHANERADYEHLLSMIKELAKSGLASLPKHLDRKIQDLQHAAQVFTGLEQPYHRSVNF
jgi:hypothetical protein